MPFMKVDADIYDEVAEELGPDAMPGGRPSGAFEYESAEAQFKPEKLGPVARVMYDALVADGARKFYVTYDGGYDEGFSHPGDLFFGDDAGERRSPEIVKRKLAADVALVVRLRAAAGKDSMWGNATELYVKASDAEAVGYALDELAHEVASRLLGDGYGTGEYQLYGAFTADLRTGEIVDHEDAPKPDSLME